MIGIISDTHGLLRPEALEPLRGVDHIIHAGDIGAPEIIATLHGLAPTTAIRGNIDKAAWAQLYPASTTLRLGGLGIHVVHDLADLRPDALEPDMSVVVYGHSHRAKVETRRGVLFLNPGSAGPKRFKLPVTVATLGIDSGHLTPEIHVLAV
ncbi:metallophosphoesterase family protein [Rubellimicrobium arenae]|uniref:metallophosphoesterase family protein n=1 Tax=Rubellimicrobium arenae TaxID=2817372 RepID=UPI001FF00FF3|nr:metallophosphoesterase family protein [Rubellimicrobium arenae]